ncbi:MAG: class I SAM-dependent methyltransferase [Spirochaetota bacterium]|nr:class I SAM-dependent methyltransferase [Spirochaetota bacterium]
MNNCPICEENGNISFVRMHYNYEILFCPDCNLQFSNPMKDPGKSFYESSSIYENRSRCTTLSMPLNDWRYQTFFKLCNPEPHQTLLDIGCGDGEFLSLIRRSGLKVFGIEIDERAVKIARDTYKLEDVECGKWEDLYDTGWRDLDIITIYDVLEHVSSPLSLIQAIFELLSPGGKICLSVPRFDRYPRIFDTVTDFPPHHFTLWSHKSLNTILSKTGFKEVKIIEKPLTSTDFLIHIFWRVKRITKKLRSNSMGNKNTSSQEMKKPSTPTKTATALRMVKRTVVLLLSNIDWIFRMFNIGRGHTLLAVAIKPDQRQYNK